MSTFFLEDPDISFTFVFQFFKHKNIIFIAVTSPSRISKFSYILLCFIYNKITKILLFEPFCLPPKIILSNLDLRSKLAFPQEICPKRANIESQRGRVSFVVNSNNTARVASLKMQPSRVHDVSYLRQTLRTEPSVGCHAPRAFRRVRGWNSRHVKTRKSTMKAPLVRIVAYPIVAPNRFTCATVFNGFPLVPGPIN